jgi:putative endonuclease
MSTKTALYGGKAEQIAAEFLVRKGFRILERNARFGRYEIDIIAYDEVEKMIVFVEVKARKRSSIAYPIRTAVTSRKRRALEQAIAHWITSKAYEGAGRTDVVCIAGTNVVEHLLNIGSDFF